MHSRAFIVPVLTLLWLLGGPRNSGAAPLTVAYVDALTGLEWAQVKGSTGYAFYQVANVCATDGITACSSDLGDVAFAGWTWATANQIMTLMANATDLSNEQLSALFFDPLYGTVQSPRSVTAADSTWAPQFLSVFAPTVVTDTYRAVLGLAATGVYFDPASAWVPEVSDAASGGIDTAGRGNLTDNRGPNASGFPSSPGSSERGVWLFRPVQVPEPSPLLLLAIGAALSALHRHRTMMSSRSTSSTF